MRKIILTVEIEEAEAVKETIESLPVPAVPSARTMRALAFNAKLNQAIQRTKGGKNGKSE